MCPPIAALLLLIFTLELPRPLTMTPRNTVYPGAFKYGGGHVIEDFVSGKDIKLAATAYGTDCYPRKKIETYINKDTVNEAYLYNPRNSYQNYNVAVNVSNKVIHTYMGVLKPNLNSANYCSAGQLSPSAQGPQISNNRDRDKDFPGRRCGIRRVERNPA